MKKLLTTTFLLFFVLINPAITFAVDQYSCTSVDVSFPQTNNWPGGKVLARCKGGWESTKVPIKYEDATCKGEEKEIGPGETVTLNQCDCLFNDGCFYIKEIPDNIKNASCNVEGSGGVCYGQNGKGTSPATITANSCKTPPGETPSQPESPAITPSETPPSEESSTPNPSETPPEESPSPTPTDTPPGSTPPGTTPPTNNTPTPTPTNTPPPTGTPPPFSDAMCQCDGIQSTPIFPGSTSTITSFGKVTGADTSNAKIASMTYFVAKNNTVIAKSDAITPGAPETSTDKVRYKTEWEYAFPNDIDPTATYRIWSQIKCDKKSLAQNFSREVVLGTQTSSQPSLLQQMLDYFTGLFNPTGQDKTANLTPRSTPNFSPLINQQQLKLGQLRPATVMNKNDTCRFLILKFNQ